MLVIPRATEKAYAEQAKNTYIFNCLGEGSKQSIAKAVEEQYNVTVTDIKVLTRKGKATRFSKGKHAYPGTTFRRDKKIAYVTLKDGDKIRVFEEESTEKPAEEPKKVEKDDKKAKKSEKGDK